MIKKLVFTAILSSIPTICSTGLDDKMVCGDFDVVPPNSNDTIPERICKQKGNLNVGTDSISNKYHL